MGNIFASQSETTPAPRRHSPPRYRQPSPVRPTQSTPSYRQPSPVRQTPSTPSYRQPPPSYRQSSPVRPSPSVRVGGQCVKHDVNDYLISKLEGVTNNNLTPIIVPYRKVVDKYSLYVCSQYNSREGCHAPVCRRFHICFYWVQGKCQRTDCPYDHDYSAVHNDIIMDTLRRRRDFNMNFADDILRNNHRHNRKSKRGDHSVICMHNIMNRCHQRDACSLIHTNKTFAWEVNDGTTWLSLAFEQSSALEELYCQPEQTLVNLPPLPNIRALQKLKSLLNGESDWKVNFSKMIMFSGSTDLDIRRLSTPSDVCCHGSLNRLATRWIWYWMDDCGVWKPYTDGCNSKFFIVGLSDWLEHQYNFETNDEVEVTVGGHSYEIDLSSLTQLNKETGKRRNVRRRPVLCELKKKEKNIYFNHFFNTQQEEDTVRYPVTPSGCEFLFMKSLMESSMESVSLVSVERIINRHTWKTYQNKKKYLEDCYRDNPSLVNEQYLFHGTSHSVVDLICKENFDWRLYGERVGHLYGQGVYFSNDAKMSSGYGDTNDGIRVMFVCLVLVGTMAIGNSDTKLPPMNDKTGRNFDTTCNDSSDSKIFVKYNRDEYYPAYVIHYRHY